MNAELPERKKQILYAVVNDYILSAEPVGSSQISSKESIELSPATIRNVMAELEERGFLERTHASSGRKPTDAGYRCYVDQLIEKRPPNKSLRNKVQENVQSGQNVQDILKDTCRLISEQAHQASLGVSPKADEHSFEHIQFCKLKGHLVLVVLVSSSGLVQNKILRLDDKLTQSDLNRMHNYLNEKLKGQSVKNIRQRILLDMKKAHSEYHTLITQALVLGEQALSNDEPNIHIEGQSHLLSTPDFATLENMQVILRSLEEKTHLVKLLDQALSSPGVKIFIGEEVDSPEINGLTLITSPYSDSEGNQGLLGVIGPKRMDYAQIIPLVEYTSDIITESLKEGNT